MLCRTLQERAPALIPATRRSGPVYNIHQGVGWGGRGVYLCCCCQHGVEGEGGWSLKMCSMRCVKSVSVALGCACKGYALEHALGVKIPLQEHMEECAVGMDDEEWLLIAKQSNQYAKALLENLRNRITSHACMEEMYLTSLEVLATARNKTIKALVMAFVRSEESKYWHFSKRSKQISSPINGDKQRPKSV